MRRSTIVIVTLCVLLAANIAVGAMRSNSALPRAIGPYFVGPALLRAEIVTKDATGIHDWRLDRGRIRSLTPTAITLRERDATIVTIPVGPLTRVTLNGRVVSFTSLRRGMNALVARDGDAPAELVQATR
jgi:hypothetical protein